MFGSNPLIDCVVAVAIGYEGTGLVAAGCSRLLLPRRRSGAVVPAGMMLPSASERSARMVMPGLELKTPVRSPRAGRLNERAYPARRTKSPLPMIGPRMPGRACGVHAAPALG